MWEAAMSAAHYKLDNHVLLDHNGLQIDGTNDEVMGVGDMMAKYEAFGFACVSGGPRHRRRCGGGEHAAPGQAAFVCCETHKGHGVSFMEDQVGWHGKAPNKEQYEQAMKNWGYPTMAESKSLRIAYGEALVGWARRTTRSSCWTRTFPTPP